MTIEQLAPGFYNMDCMEGMKHFPDNYFDLAIVDPPYGIGIGHKVKREKTITIVGGTAEGSSAVTVNGASRTAKSSLNFIIHSTIARRRMVDTLKSFSEYQKRK